MLVDIHAEWQTVFGTSRTQKCILFMTTDKARLLKWNHVSYKTAGMFKHTMRLGMLSADFKLGGETSWRRFTALCPFYFVLLVSLFMLS